jgi:hypothetical protein
MKQGEPQNERAAGVGCVPLENRQEEVSAVATLPIDTDLDETGDRRRIVDMSMRLSSYELYCGLRVEEQAFDTLPGELQEALIESQSSRRRSWLDDDPGVFIPWR